MDTTGRGNDWVWGKYCYNHTGWGWLYVSIDKGRVLAYHTGMGEIARTRKGIQVKDIYDANDRTTGSAKLTAEDVRVLRARYRAGQVTVRGIAAVHRMSAEAVRRMLRGETWAWVEDMPPPALTEEQHAAMRASEQRLLRELSASTAATAAKGAEIVEQLGGPAMSDNARALLATLRGERPARADDSGNSGGEAAV